MIRRKGLSDFGDAAPSAELNLTPLLDVVFVVLIMFIIVVPMLELDQVHLASGRPDHPQMRQVTADSPVTLHVRRDNSIWLGGQQIPPERLEELLKEAHNTYADAIPQLFHDRHAEFGTYQSVKNAAEAAGFTEMEVILEPAGRTG